jgi:hypothetical protein
MPVRWTGTISKVLNFLEDRDSRIRFHVRTHRSTKSALGRAVATVEQVSIGVNHSCTFFTHFFVFSSINDNYF